MTLLSAIVKLLPVMDPVANAVQMLITGMGKYPASHAG